MTWSRGYVPACRHLNALKSPEKTATLTGVAFQKAQSGKPSGAHLIAIRSTSDIHHLKSRCSPVSQP